MHQYTSNRGPIASQLLPTGAAFHALLRTARIPMSAFGNGYSNRNVRYVWFDFRPTTRGGFIIGEISGQTIAVEQSPALVAEAGGSAGPAVEISDEADIKEVTAMAGEFPPGVVNAAAVSRDRNRIISITSVTGINEAGSERGSDEAQADLVRVELESSRPFPATAAGLTLTIGSFTFTEPDPFQDGSMRRIAFKVPAAVFQSRAEAGDAMSVSAWASMPAWQFGNLDAWMMR